MRSTSKLLVLALCLFALTGVASATSIACPVATLSFYAANFGQGSGNDCFIGDKHFTGFTFTFVASAPTTLVFNPTLTPHEPIPGELMGFNITGFFTGEISRTLNIVYNAYTDSGAALIHDVEASINGFFTSGPNAPGTGSLSYNEDLCVGGSYSGAIGSLSCSGTLVAGAINQLVTSGTVSDSYTLTSLVSVLGIHKTLLLSPVSTSGPNRSGFASLDNDVSQILPPPTGVPEPGTLALIGFGLLAVAGLKRRSTRKNT